jgi:hypothetical protein
MARVQAWSTTDFKKHLASRLKHAKKKRERFEEQWRNNERTVFYWNSRNPNSVTLTEDNLLRLDNDDIGQTEQTELAINYCWKFLRFIHSQMSANPPSVIARPTSTDPEDHQKADAADRIVRFAYAQQDMQEMFDHLNLKALTYGTGYIRTYWDDSQGEALDYDDKTQNITMTGEICQYAPSTWDIWLDPVAKRWKDVRFFYERVELPVDEAYFRWPEYKEQLDRFIRVKPRVESEIQDWREQDEVVEVYYYVEKALPINGMAGRMACCLEDGTVLGKPTHNLNPDEKLGLAIETDIDLPDEVYGVSFLQYVYKLQELLNRLDTSFVDNIAAHNVVRMVLPQGSEIEDESLSNSAWDYVKITGGSGSGPYYVPAASLMPDAHKLRENLISGIQELAGVNDSMQGVQKREMSGFSMQTAIDAGNTVRRRLFNKYTLAVRDVFRDYLANARKHWTDPRTILVLGKENAFEAADFKGADIDGGYDITCEYGAALSLDPARRREEIMQLMPVFEKAGVPTKTILSMLKLNELETMYDRMTLAELRQREIFEEIVSTRKQVEPRDLQDHQGMLTYCYVYVMTSTYKYLDPELQQLIDTHIKTREQMSKQAATQGQANPATAAAAAGGGAPSTGPEQLNNPQSAQADGGGAAIPTGLPAKVLAAGNATPPIAPAA